MESPAVSALRRRLRTLPRPQPLFLEELRSHAALLRLWAGGTCALAVVAVLVRAGLTGTFPTVPFAAPPPLLLLRHARRCRCP